MPAISTISAYAGKLCSSHTHHATAPHPPSRPRPPKHWPSQLTSAEGDSKAMLRPPMFFNTTLIEDTRLPNITGCENTKNHTCTYKFALSPANRSQPLSLTPAISPYQEISSS